MEDIFKVGDRVITSKGRFAKVESTNEKKSIIAIGSNLVEIYNKELLKLDNSKVTIVEYYKDFVDMYNSPLKEIIHIDKRIFLFDFNNPMTNHILEECTKKLVKRLGYSSIIITKIILA